MQTAHEGYECWRQIGYRPAVASFPTIVGGTSPPSPGSPHAGHPCTAEEAQRPRSVVALRHKPVWQT
ncbi:Taurine catabolism dioxygenase TauD/TfdA [Colletotrichum scovillei]|uniref:Taurine catabolism dioxygenase TauD/TfdA n=1 Tax=Colletotrichum scovillei TaxID=1209932 RepID=A0A9P7U966_9PEZI|nr:Taurine catabolism dioxygenase TauD/TfdA [Colletotrichum scovillei]KAG7052251.1 Taurine catabolism dioxygenase TauD/TfdA [Colletotrichum scovillei]KAG7064542.1 Taurine catabolism dioxygenase TauD/TfdA [Colletotrichum scovillei]